MIFVADAGAWTTGPDVSDAPALAVLEVSGAVLAWTVDDPAGVAATRVAITDGVAADWLWRLVGPRGHAAVVDALRGSHQIEKFELTDVDLQLEALAPLRRLAVGHWLRRWWPESRRDGIARLDPALIDAELAVLTSAAQEYFTEDTLDSGVDTLLAPHQAALLGLERGGDPRIVALVQSCRELADDLGVWSTAELTVAVADSPDRRRDDYALAAGPDTVRAAGAIARGVGSVNWIAVPPGIFDAAERTVDWSVESADAAVVATVRVATTGETSARGIEVQLSSDGVVATGVLDVTGTAAVTLVGQGGLPLTETQAWDHDWSQTTVVIGPEVADTVEAQGIRSRMRDFARRRLAQPGADAFLAEVVAAESDY